MNGERVDCASAAPRLAVASREVRLLDSDDDAFLGRRNDLLQVEARSVHLGIRP